MEFSGRTQRRRARVRAHQDIHCARFREVQHKTKRCKHQSDRARADEPRAREKSLAKDDLIQAEGTVNKILGGGRYEIRIDSGQTVTAQMSGRMRRFRIRVIPGDRVQIGLSPYDPSHGFITFRLREDGQVSEMGAGAAESGKGGKGAKGGKGFQGGQKGGRRA